MQSIFTNKSKQPTEADLKKALGKTFGQWQALAAFTKESDPQAIESWHFTSEKYGWSFRISDKKRALIYLLPRDRFFKIAFVFGQKATDKILASGISENIKNELRTAKVYAEGRGIRIDVTATSPDLDDLKTLIRIKLEK